MVIFVAGLCSSISCAIPSLFVVVTHLSPPSLDVSSCQGGGVEEQPQQVYLSAQTILIRLPHHHGHR